MTYGKSSDCRLPSADCLLLETLVWWQPGTDLFKRVVAIFNYAAQKIVSIDSNRFKEHGWNFLEGVVDSLRSIHLFAARKLHRSIYGSAGKRLDWFVDCHRLFAFDNEL